MKAARRSESRLATLGTVGAIAAVTSWGIGPVVVKGTDLPAPTVSLYRLGLGAAITVVILYCRGQRLSWELMRAALPGGVAFGRDIVIFFSAVKLTTVADATIISALQPALLLLVANRLFGETVRRLDVTLTLLAIGGVAVVVAASGQIEGRTLRGDLLAVAALGAWTCYFVAAKQARQRFGALEYQAALSVIAALVVAPVALLTRSPLLVTDGASLWLLAITVVLGASGHFIMNWAHAYTPITLSSVLTLASPVISVAAAALFLDETVLAVQVVGMAVVIVSLGLVVARRSPSVSGDVADPRSPSPSPSESAVDG